jgi:hypothetical protein
VRSPAKDARTGLHESSGIVRDVPAPPPFINTGDGHERPIVRIDEHYAENGFAIIEYVVGRHPGQAQDGVTMSMYVIRRPSGEYGASLHPSYDEALGEMRKGNEPGSPLARIPAKSA